MGGRRVRMMQFARARSAAMSAPLVRTPFAKPIFEFENRWLSMVGKTMPPQDAPETIMPVAKARRLRK